jgi:hypothetical protein
MLAGIRVLQVRGGTKERIAQLLGTTHMIVKLRSLLLAIIALAATVVIAAVPGVAPQIALLATTALIMGGAGHPLSIPPDSLGFVTRYRDVGVNQYIIPSGTTPDKVVVVPTPEARLLGFGFDPFFTFRGLFDGPFDKAVAEGVKDLDACIEVSGCVYTQAASTGAPQKGDSFIVYGYSQSSTIATLEKRALMERYPEGTKSGSPNVSFILTANGNRPNGGILARGPQGLTIPIAGLTFSGPTPTDSYNNVYPTIDISRQYDGWSDQPTNPLNPFSEVNALFAMYYIHQNYDEVTLGQGIKQDVVGDTTYYLVPTPILPMLMPLESVPVVGNALADTLDPFFRVLVEAGYDRTISPGTPTNWNVLYFPNPVNLVHNLGEAIPTGLDNGISDLTKDENNRPLGTERPGPYGVGGPPVTLSDQTSPATNQQTTSPDTGNPVLTATTEGTQETELPQPEEIKPPVLTALNNAATRVQAQGEVRQNPLGIPNGSSVLLDGVPGGSKATGAVNGQTGVGSPLKQVGDAVKDAVDNVLKPKPATSSTP